MASTSALTATQQALAIDIEKLKAHKQAIMLVYELAEAGYLADCCRGDAIYHLAELFFKNGIEFTTKYQREVQAATEQKCQLPPLG